MKLQHIGDKLNKKLLSLGVKALPSNDIEEIIKCSEQMLLNKNEVFDEECMKENIHLVIKGSFRYVDKDSCNKEKVLRFSFPNDILFSFNFGDKPHRIIANTKSLIIKTPIKEITLHTNETVTEFNDRLKTRALKIMDKELEIKNVKYEEAYQYTLSAHGDEWQNISQIHIAGYLGITVQHLQRVIKRINTDSTIKKSIDII